ncbi:DUF6702 family protein [Fulvivirga lutea]|uniref:Peptidase E n=1 Tax=Fulvivirga lutea TaxID=2810512 RepID=A0A975A1E9_9BACT|nr:DUF6702 family protein [Fulvivirga lutea]QSE98170.1 hypothetical protein JR347_03570 [Fulvivirga lutea]
MSAFLLSVVIYSMSYAHPIHLSITNAEWDRERNAIECVTKIFLDDLNSHFVNTLNDPYFDITLTNQKYNVDSLLANYLSQFVSIYINGEHIKMEYIGFEHNLETMNLYYQLLNVKQIITMEMKNTILLDSFTDQSNMLHFTIGNDTKAIRMNADKPQGKIELQ